MGIDLQRSDRLYKLHRFREAIEAASREIVVEPDSALAYGLRGSAWLALGENALAAEDIRAAARIAPEQAYVHYLLSFVCANEGDHERAIGAVESAIALQPHAHYFARRAELLTKQKDFHRALASAEKALQLDPNLEAAHISRSIALFKLGRTSDAEAMLHSALALNPENPTVHSLLGSLGLNDKPPEIVASHLREARRISPVLHNRTAALKVAYGRLIWPFSTIERGRRCYLNLTPKRRWLLDASVSTLLTSLLAATQSNPFHPSLLTIAVFVLFANIIAVAYCLDVHTPLAATLFNRREFSVSVPALAWSTVKHLYVWTVFHLFLVSGVGVSLAVLPKAALYTFSVLLNWPMGRALTKQSDKARRAARIILPGFCFIITMCDFFWTTPPLTLLAIWAGIAALSAVVNHRLYWHRSEKQT